ncbi:retrovirus-related pol polyprotein from transposon TNT 1-94 [Tanacetum coccineum]
MTGDRSLLRNFIEKFMGTVRFGNDNFAAITGYGDYIHGNITICHVYYVEGLGHNLFSVGQFCDGDLEVAFRSNTCYVRNLEGDDLLTGGRDSNLYTISISDMAASSPVCLMSKATSTKSWLWHRRLSHLNFGTINDLTRLDLVDGLPKFKYGKDHLCSACERGKSKKASHPPKLVPSDHSKLELLHMDLCGPMRVASINGKKYILVIVDEFSRYTWVYFLRSKDETPEIIKKFIAQAQLNYKAKVCKIWTDNGTEFKNATLKAHYEKLGIMQQFSIARLILFLILHGFYKSVKTQKKKHGKYRENLNSVRLINFFSKFLGTVRFGNDQIAKIMGYGDYQLGNVTISRVYYVEGLGHNFVRGGTILDTNLYTISLDDMFKTSPICLLSKASKTKSCLGHVGLSTSNFVVYLNSIAKDGLAKRHSYASIINQSSLCAPQCALLQQETRMSFDRMTKNPDLSFLHVFGFLLYPTNDSEDLGKLKAKADIGIFVGYAPVKKAF